jgi:hypothetical protein
MVFEQATIKVQNEQEFAELQSAVQRAFLKENVERFLKQLDRKAIRVRDFDGVLAQRVLEGFADKGLGAKEMGTKETPAQSLYSSLPVSDQALMREFYLSKLETVEQSLRHRFKKLYQYY